MPKENKRKGRGKRLPTVQEERALEAQEKFGTNKRRGYRAATKTLRCNWCGYNFGKVVRKVRPWTYVQGIGFINERKQYGVKCPNCDKKEAKE